jgi:hypothetical protein
MNIHHMDSDNAEKAAQYYGVEYYIIMALDSAMHNFCQATGCDVGKMMELLSDLYEDWTDYEITEIREVDWNERAANAERQEREALLNDKQSWKKMRALIHLVKKDKPNESA